MIYLYAAFAALALLCLAAWLLEWKLIADWRKTFRKWSFWLDGTGWLSVGVLYPVWSMLPEPIQRMLPQYIFLIVTALMFVARSIAVWVEQEKLRHGQ